MKLFLPSNFCYSLFNIFSNFLLNFLILEKSLHDIFQIVAEWYDKKYNPRSYVEKFLREYGSKEFNKQTLNQQAFSCSKLGKQTFMLDTLASHDKYTDYLLSLDIFSLQIGPRRSSDSQRNRLPNFSSQKKLKEEVN